MNQPDYTQDLGKIFQHLQEIDRRGVKIHLVLWPDGRGSFRTLSDKEPGVFLERSFVNPHLGLNILLKVMDTANRWNGTAGILSSFQYSD